MDLPRAITTVGPKLVGISSGETLAISHHGLGGEFLALWLVGMMFKDAKLFIL